MPPVGIRARRVCWSFSGDDFRERPLQQANHDKCNCRCSYVRQERGRPVIYTTIVTRRLEWCEATLTEHTTLAAQLNCLMIENIHRRTLLSQAPRHSAGFDTTTHPVHIGGLLLVNAVQMLSVCEVVAAAAGPVRSARLPLAYQAVLPAPPADRVKAKVRVVH